MTISHLQQPIMNACLIVNNFASPHSPGANCKEDNSDGALDSLKNFIYKIQEETTDIDTIEEEDDHFAFTTTNNERIKKTHAYIAGYVARKILRKV
ncbi:hypothetical protein QE152_g25597 [Popillia japonica]|uniref:Uncharacterized protein n=1 Tax=Popillia japonica TaxID=7064 RepID=A0AAW1JZM2_POPJA